MSAAATFRVLGNHGSEEAVAVIASSSQLVDEGEEAGGFGRGDCGGGSGIGVREGMSLDLLCRLAVDGAVDADGQQRHRLITAQQSSVRRGDSSE